MEWYYWLVIGWGVGILVACLFFYGASKKARRFFCVECGSWWEFCQCEAVQEVGEKEVEAIQNAADIAWEGAVTDRYTKGRIRTVYELVDVLEKADPDSLILMEDSYNGDFMEVRAGGIMPFHLNKKKGRRWASPHVLAKPEDEEAGVEAIMLTFNDYGLPEGD